MNIRTSSTFELFVQERRPKSVPRALVDECGKGSHFGTFAAVLHFTSSHHFPGQVLHLMHPWCDDHQSVRLMAVASETSRFGEGTVAPSHEELRNVRKTKSSSQSKSTSKIGMMDGSCRNTHTEEIVLPLAQLT